MQWVQLAPEWAGYLNRQSPRREPHLDGRGQLSKECSLVRSTLEQPHEIDGGQDFRSVQDQHRETHSGADLDGNEALMKTVFNPTGQVLEERRDEPRFKRPERILVYSLRGRSLQTSSRSTTGTR